MTSKTVQALAYELNQAFKSATRDNGDSYVKLVGGSPDWMTDAIRDAHGDTMPDDWRYLAIRDVAGFMAEIDAGEDVEDHSHECVDQLVDVYTGRLTAWLASSLARFGYCDQAVEDGLITADAGMFKRLQGGQYVEYREIYDALARFLSNMVEEVGQ